MREHTLPTAIAEIGDALAPEVVRHHVEGLDLINRVVVRGIHRLRDAGVGVRLHRRLNSHVLLGRQVIRRDEPARFLGVRCQRVRITPRLQERVVDDVLPGPVAPSHREVVDRLDSRGHA